ncbi:MAG: hypothetical protein IJT05_03175 [Lachnospiraceae bacterium]|nr:hypothetical protein [Lachnospiraceae bacterium]
MKEIFFSLLLVGILRGMDRLGMPVMRIRSRKIIYLDEYKKRVRLTPEINM